ncbi:ABC transporter ATP-binding protein [Jeotgalibacillus proteolyticus]|uniref:Iron ABC transporter ATP-binding protein n=1 Tax=Jeotgalibacillus proteolyticus TaxID=2082395 RepID=A0A2S5GDB3_9BACL|nr:ABC transporter ATP-binding protein [Jeotgalibacillus proteolyticus]PPA70901.1 iron ABC transporter ATP-binding protein [Jeotgalibacillus proteolyticus]
MVVAKNVFKFFGKKKVVEDVSITIPKGKITSLIGPNGAGKSTLLSMVSRLLTSDGGEITIDELDVAKCRGNDLAKKVSILKQANNVTLKLTVRELVSFGRFPYSQGKLTKEDHTYVDEAIRYMELEELENSYLNELSGGQKQRAYLAMVIAQDTEYILLDEPLNNLDMKHAVQMMKVLRKLVDELGKTVAIVIHDINFASCYSDYIIAMKDGKVAKEGTVHDMIRPCVLKEIYDLDMNIEDVNNNKICVYYA